MEFKDKFSNLLKLVLGEEIDFTLEIDGNKVIINTDPENVKFLIGRKGRTIRAIREVIYIYNKIHATEFEIEIPEDDQQASLSEGSEEEMSGENKKEIDGDDQEREEIKSDREGSEIEAEKEESTEEKTEK